MVTYKEKAIVYIVKNAEVRDKIYRKLNYLINHNNREELMGSRIKAWLIYIIFICSDWLKNVEGGIWTHALSE